MSNAKARHRRRTRRARAQANVAPDWLAMHLWYRGLVSGVRGLVSAHVTKRKGRWVYLQAQAAGGREVSAWVDPLRK